MPLKFHWRLLQGGEQGGVAMTKALQLEVSAMPELEAQVEFCRRAEECGIDSLLVDISFAKPDPVALSTALGVETEKIRFMLAARSGIISPLHFVRQVNTLSVVTGGRVCLNIVAGHSPDEQKYYGDFLAHDERYERTDEFLAVCHAFWRGGEVEFEGKHFGVVKGRVDTPFVCRDGRAAPELFISGSSEAAVNLAVRQGSCWMRFADSPERICGGARPVLEAGKEVGLRLSVIARPTREEALRAAYSLIKGLDPAREDSGGERRFMRQSDSQSMKSVYELAESQWLTPYLWAGAVRTYGAPALALVGTPEDVAAGLIEYGRAGVTQFILAGWPKLEEMIYFGREVLPLVRRMEAEELGRGQSRAEGGA